MAVLKEYGGIQVADVAEALRGLSGRVPASELFRRYAEAAEAAGRVPGHPTGLGQHWAARGLKRCKLTVDGRQVVAWEIPSLPESGSLDGASSDFNQLIFDLVKECGVGYQPNSVIQAKYESLCKRRGVRMGSKQLLGRQLRAIGCTQMTRKRTLGWYMMAFPERVPEDQRADVPVPQRARD